MARTKWRGSRTRVRLWRWRRSPLRRRTDVVEAWLLLAVWVLAVAGGLVAGLVTADAGVRSFDRLRAERHEVSAVLTRDAKDSVSPVAVDDHHVWADVRWRGRDGSVHLGQARASANAHAGDRVTIWTDDHGALVSAPPQHGEAQVEAAILGTLAAGAAGGVVWAAGRVVRGRLMQGRMRAWDDEWARADLRWGGRTG